MKLPGRPKALVAGIASVALFSAGLGVANAAVTNVGALAVSLKADRSSPVSLAGATVKGNAYIFLNRDKATSVTFYLDASATPVATELVAPYDLATTAADGTAKPLDTTKLVDGAHTVKAVMKSATRTRTFTAKFAVKNTVVSPTTTTTTTKPTTTTTAAPTTTTAKPTTTTVKPTTTVPPTTVPAGGKPGATNTGVPAGTALTVVTGNQTYSTSGQVISGLDIRGKVRITGNNITLKNSIVRGPQSGGCVNGAALELDGTGVVVQDVEVAVSNPTACLDAVNASNAVLTRMNIHGGVDGLKLDSNATLRASWVHDLNWFASDPNQGGGETHNDTVQILSGANIVVDGNNLDATGDGTNAAIQITQDFGLISNLNITKNWMDGGGCSLNVAHKGGTSLTVGASNNRFGRNSYYNCPILLSTKSTLNGTGNVWDDTGLTVPIQVHD